jgi:citrate lyase subunit beta/citryl-CoA lyase
MSEIDLRPRRSVLYMPGANERALEKAKSIVADALILDLEDAVAPDAKAEARVRVCAAAGSGEYGLKEVTIRCNSRDTQWHRDDIMAIARSGAAAVVVPKIDSVDDVRAVDDELLKSGAPESLKIWGMLETPEAVLHAEQIALASSRLTVLVMGTNDLAKELRAEHVPGRHPLLFGLGACVMAARLAGKVILDGVYNDIKNEDGFRDECVQGWQMGFDGKTLIHPSQVEPCNDVFAPGAPEIAAAQEIIAAFDEARAAGKGVVTVNGRMIENLHVDNARRVLAQADAIAKLA